jgi:LysM repeat protein
MSAITLTNQGFYASNANFRSSGTQLNRRGRLARTLVVLSLAIVLASLVSAKAGAGTEVVPAASGSFVTITVAPGETLWSLAARVEHDGDLRSLVSQIVSVNSLESVDLMAGQKIRIPLK